MHLLWNSVQSSCPLFLFGKTTPNELYTTNNTKTVFQIAWMAALCPLRTRTYLVQLMVRYSRWTYKIGLHPTNHKLIMSWAVLPYVLLQNRSDFTFSIKGLCGWILKDSWCFWETVRMDFSWEIGLAKLDHSLLTSLKASGRKYSYKVQPPHNADLSKSQSKEHTF